MPITAIALLRISHTALTGSGTLKVEALDDGVLVHTGQSFASEPSELSLALHAALGDALQQHRDERGILFIPDVAAPKQKTYERVIEEVGEGGVWGPLVDELGEEGDFGALLGNLLGQMPTSLLAAANAAAQGQPGAFESAAAQLSQLMNNSSELQGLAAQMAGMLGQPMPQPGPRDAAPPNVEDAMGQMAQLLEGSGLDLSSPALQEMAAKMQAALGAEEPAPEPEPPEPKREKK